MDIREKLKAKRRKKKSLVILTSIALLTTTLATMKLTGFSMPLNKRVKNEGKAENIASTYSTQQTYANSNGINIVTDKTIYIDAENGDDSTGNGDIDAPYKTLNKITETGIIEQGYSYLIVLGDGEYELKQEIFTLNCNDSIHILGNKEKTILKVNGIFPNSLGGSPAYSVNFYRLIWDGNNYNNNNTVFINNPINLYAVAFKNISTDGWTSYFLPTNNMTINNCVNSGSVGVLLRTTNGTIKLTNCYGNFVSGYYTSDSNWNYQTNYITSSPSVNEETYEITDKESIWEGVGTGTNPDGTTANLGVYGGEYSWDYELNGELIKKYKIQSVENKIEIGDSFNLQIVELTGQEENPDETQWSWSSSNENIMSVDSNGKITALGKGIVTITARNLETSRKLTIKLRIYPHYSECKIYADKMIYIDSNNGSDETGDGTKENPYKTLNKITDSGIIEKGYYYAVILADGEYELTEGVYTLNCNKSLRIVGNKEKTVLKVAAIFPNSHGGSTDYSIEFYRFVWYGTSNDTNTIFAKNSMNFYNVAFKMYTQSLGNYFLGGTGGIKFYNCTSSSNIPVRTDTGLLQLTNCYGGFVSGYGTSNSSWDYQTNYITNSPLVETELYMITDDESVWENVGTGINNSDGKTSNLGVYGGNYDWDSEAIIKKIKRYDLNYRNEYIKIGDTINAELTETSGQEQNPDESKWTWSSSNSDVATVDSNGVVKGISVGHTTITGYNDEENAKVKAIVNVYRNKEGAITAPQVVEGEGSTVILKEDGTVWSTGYNCYGQLGLGDTLNRNTPEQVKIDEKTYLTNVIKISGAYAHTIALTKDGEVYTWGYNNQGQLGQGDKTNRLYATKVKGVNGEGYIENIIDIAISYENAYVIDENGNLFGCGSSSAYQLLGNSTTYTLAKLNNVTNAISINAGYSDAGVILSNGETWIWGHNPYGSNGNGTTASASTETCLGNDIAQIKLDGYSGYILKENGTVWSSGLNNYGQLGVGDTTNRTSYTQVKLEDGTELKAKTIEAGAKNLSVIGTDKKVYVTGYNGYGQLGDKSTTNVVYPKVMINEDATDVTDVISLIAGSGATSSNSRNMGIIRQDGTVWLSGDNTYGQIGNETNTSTNYLTKLGTNEIILNARNEYMKIGDTIDIDVLKASEFNVFIKDVPEQSDWTWTSSNEDVALVNDSGVVIGKTVGHTTITGYNSKNGLKAKAIINVYRNKEGAITVPKIENGNYFTVILKEDGTVWTTGYNNVGQLGNGTTTNSNIPVQVKIDEDTYLTNVVDISSGPDSACALTKDGYVYAWGSNQYGNLGQGNTTNLSYATKMKGVNGEGYLENIIQISQGRHEIFALTANGEIYGSGYGAHNTYLDSVGSTHTTTTKVKGISNCVFVEIGVCDVFAILSKGETWGWGHNPYGELGNGTTSSASPTKYLIGDDFNEISTNGYSSIAIKEDGTVWTAGYNNYGQLGQGDTSNRTTFTQTLLSSEDGIKAKYVNMAEYVAIVLGKDGKMYTAGVNNYGQLSQGNTTNTTKFIPMYNKDKSQVEDTLLITTTGATYSGNIEKNTSIIKKDGTVWLSGDNTYGQIGNATNSSTNYLTKLGTNEVILNVRNEYIKIGDTVDIDVLEASGFNVFIQDEMKQEDWTWNSYNDDVASIDNNGIVTAKSIGYTTISGYNNKTGLIAKAIINVYNNKEKAVTVPQVKYADSFTTVLKEDGTVWTSGQNNYGQLGDGTTTDKNKLVQVKINEDTYLTNVKKISTGREYTIALTNDGKVYTWGYNQYGQLAQGDTTNYNYAKQAKIDETTYMDNVIDIVSGEIHSIALTANGTVFVTGHNYWYQNTTTGRENAVLYFKETSIKNTIKVEAGYSNCVAMLSNGSVYAWGHNPYGALETQGNPTLGYVIATDIVDIALNGYSTMILNKNGEIYATGYNNVGQLGLGDTTSRNILTKVELPTTEKVKYIGGTSSNLTCMTKDGKVYVTGYNAFGQLCDGTTTNSTTFIPLKNQDGTEVTDAIMLAGLGENSNYNTLSRGQAVLREDGTVWMSGDNTYGQIGNASNTSTNYLTKIGTNEVILNKRNEYIKIGETQDIDVLYASGFNVFIGNAPNQSDWTWKSSNEDVATIDNSGIVTGKEIGHTTITGYNSKNGLKAKVIINVYRNVEGAITVPKVENGDYFTVILKEDGTVWTTGYNNAGQLGNGTTTNSNIPVQVKIDEDTYLTNVVDISVGPDSASALTKDGYVYAWGSNQYGNLGQGNTTNLSYATRMKGVNGEGYLENIIQISQGRHEIFALTANGEIYGSGFGAHNTYLDGITSTHTTITKVKEISNCVFVEIGVCDVFAILSNGETWSWGHNPHGELGNGTTASTSPTKYLIGDDFNEISTNGYSSIAIKEDGTVWTSGLNNYGQLGLGDTSNRTTFTQTLLSCEDGIKAKYVNMAEYVAIVLGKDGKMYTAGINNYGQLSQGNTTNSTKFIPMLNINGTEVTDCLLLTTTGSTYYNNIEKNTAIIRQDGTVWLSGDNTYGQIGNATNTSSTYLTKMGDGFLNYPEKWITMSVNESKKINSMLFSIEEDMNVFVDKNSKLGDLTYTVEDEEIASVTDLGMITGKAQGITKIKVQDTVTGATTNIWVKVVEDKNVQIDLGYKFTVALKQDGSVWSWGENHVGQLGLGNTTYYNEPQKITGITEKITDVKSGYYHSIALSQNGEVYTWGYNYYGQCGTGDTQNVLTPVKVEGLTNIVKIDAYKYMTIALTQGGEVYVWGNGYGPTPVKLNFTRKIIDVAGNIVLAENRRAYNLNETTSYGKDLIKISAGENHYLGLTADGKVFAWGTNSYGQLGNGNNTSSNIPTKVVTPEGTTNISDIVEISAGSNYSIITDKDGKVYTFGYYGNYRTANTAHSNKPVEITGLSKAELVAGSEGGHTAIADWDGYVYTVGLNDAGQLGLKDSVQRSTFEMVGELQITCEPEKITMNVGDSQNISLSLSSSFNLKSDKQNTSSVNKQIANEAVASLSGDTVTALSVGKTILNATYEGTIGSVSTDIQKFYRNIEIEVLPEGGIVVPKVETGNGFTISLKADGTVWSWGQNQYGQLGLGNTVSYNEPQKVSIIKETITNADGTTTKVEEVIKDIAVENYQVLALGETGKVYTWGLGNCGQLGIGNGYNYYTPVIATDIYGTQLTDIVKVEAGENVSFAINSKGISYAWGNGYTSRAQKLDVTDNIIDVTSKYVLSGDGKVYNIATKEALAIVGKIVELDEGTNHTVMLTSEQKAYAIGDNTYGQLANGNNVSSEETPVAVRIDSENLFTGIKEIKAGDKTTIIVTTDGKIYTCGMNDNNELGIENTEILDRNLPEENTNISNVIFANVGSNHVVVVKEDGTVYAWGNGKQGELGNRTNKNSIVPVMVGDYIVRTNTNEVVLQVNEEKIVEGYVDYFNIFNNDAINLSYTSKDSSVVTLTDTQGNNTQNATLNSNGKFEIKLTGKKTGTTIVTANQENSSNIGVIQVEVVPKTLTASDLGITISPDVITNGSHTISLRVDGKVFTWGDNTYGQLGNGTTVSSDEPVEVTFPEGTIITKITAGENHNVALDSNGNVWTWGRNNNYQIGHSGGNQYTPYKVTGLPKVIRVAAGNNNTMVITENNELYAWGLNAYGDLGLGTYTNKVLPIKVTGIGDIIDISGGKSHFIALNRAGEVYVTGSNLYGQLGIGTNEINKINEFTKLNINEKIGTVDSGELSNIVTTVDGYVYAWGGNTYGQLGTSDKENKDVPTRINNVQNIREVDVGKTHTVIRDGSNNVFVTGTNTYGMLGIGTKDTKLTFEQNTKIDNVIRVSAGNTYTTFLKEDGFVWACGDYNHGDKEKKSRTKAQVPVLVGSDTSSLDTMEIVLMKSQIKNIMANAKFKFNLIYIEENDTSDFSYSSYNEEIAKVDEDGDILGIREGTTWVKVTDGKTGKVHIAIVRVIDNNTEYETHVAPNVVAGENFAVALKEDGTIWTWGYEVTGLADTNVPINTNVLSTYKQIDAGKNHVVATRIDGTVWTVGDNTYGQLGIGNLENKSKLVQIEGLTDITSVVAGETHTLAIDSYGIVYGWGSNANGELSSEYIGQDTNIPVVITIPNERIMQMAAGKNQSVFVTSNGTVYGMGSILNGYVPNIENAVKVDVGDNYILILRADGSIYKYQYGILTKVSNVTNAIDISVQNKVNMYQSQDEKAYTWGVNTSGQLGINSTSSVSTPSLVSENGTNVFRIGSGYNNTFTILNTGFTYAAGNNTYGELGNGTSNNETSTTKDRSLVHTLVGDRNFEIEPTSNTLEINEIEEIEVKSNTFNVFRNKAKDLSEYNWNTEDGTIVTVLDNGKIQGINIGTTKLLVTDKVTGETKEGTRVVVPVDTDRIESITASGKEAEVTDAYKYEVRVPVDDTTTTSQVTIKTKLGTDQISVDGGKSWQTGIITTTVDITNDSTTLPFIVKTEAGNELNYTLTIIRVSNDNTLSNITVKKAGETIETPASKISNKVYEIVVPNSGVNVVKVTANHSKAQVSIKGLQSELKEQTYNLVMTKPVEELPIKITSESGREESYTLRVYTKEYVTTLSKVLVNGVEATKVSDTDYQITITDEIDLSSIKAITNLSTSKVGINGGTKQVNTITENVSTVDDVTTVTIQVENEDGTLTNEYTLTINKQRTNSKIQELQVEGQTIKEINNVYTAYVTSDVTNATVKITAKDTDYYITLADFAEESYVVEKGVEVNADTNTYSIKVRDDVSGEINNYTLIIKRGDTEVGIKDIYAVNGSIVKTATQVSDTEYEIKVLDTYTDTNLTVNTINSQSKVEIDGNGYSVGTNTKTIPLTDKETTVPVVVTTADGGKTKEYTVKIIRVSDDASLNTVAVNELLGNPDIQATLSTTEADTYEVQLQNPVTLVKVIASTTNSNAQIKIADNSYIVNEDTKEITIDSSITEVKITVKSEYGTEKEYTLKIKTLSDDSNIQEVVVDGVTATYNKILGRYEVRLANTYTKYNITAKAKDLVANIKLDASTGSVNGSGTAQAEENKSGEETIVPITVTAQNGIASTTYSLAIIEQSDVADIGIVKVNGTEITADGEGNYIANVKSTTSNAEIFVQAKNEYAAVTVDSETNNTNNVTITRQITENSTVYTIKVVSEDGTNTVEKTLTINRLSGNTNIAKIEVATPDGATYTPILQADGTYYVKVKRQDSADVTVTLEDTKSSVTIAGEVTSTQTVTLLNEITEVNVLIEAEDGTQKTELIKIEKESNDASLLSITSNDAISVSYIGSNIYEVQVYDTLQALTINAETTNKLAKIKLGTEDETQYVLNKLEGKTIDLTTGITSFTIDVLAEDGTTTKTYTVEITKKFDTKIESIVVDDETATKNENIYSGWANADDILNIVITPANSSAKVSVYKDNDLVKEGTGTITLAETMTSQTATYKIIVSNPDNEEESSTYILNVTKKSTNNNVEYVKVNGVTLTENTDTGIYEVQVGTSSSYVLQVKAENEYATIKYDDGQYSATNTQSATYTILPGETKEVVVTVKSQNGEEITKTVRIYRMDNNLNVTTVKVNGTDITASYNPTYKNYSITLDNTLISTNLEIALESTKSKLSTTIDGNTYENVTNILVDNVSLPGIGKKEITFTVTSEEGTTETRTITISQFSSDIELEKLQVNGKDATKLNDGNYEVIIGDIPNVATIYAKTKEATTSVGINGNTAVVGEQTININNITVGSFIQVPVRLIAADGTEYEYELYITVKSGNNKLETVKVNNIDATKLDDTTYRIFVNETATQATVDITAESGNSIIKTIVSGAEETGNPLNFVQTLSQEKTKVNFTIVSESGEEKEYTLEIIKESNDNTLKNVYVNGIELQKDETTGRYKATVNVEDGNPIVKAITNNEFGYVRIALFDEEQSQSERTVQMSDSKVTTIPITVRSQTGVTNIEYVDIEKIYSTASIDTLAVDGIEVTNYNDNTKTYTAIVDGKLQEHEIFIMSGNTYATIEINEDIGAGNVTTFTTMNDEIYYKTIPFTVTSESGEVITYKLTLIKKSSNVNITELVVNDVTVLPDEEKPDIYRKTIKKLADKAKVKVVTEYPYASVKIGDNEEGIGTSEVWVDLSLTQDEITVPVLVTATDGETIATYNIILTRLSNDTSAIVSYDGVELSKDENGKYNVSILDTVTEGVIKVITNDENAKVDIANTQEYVTGEKEYTLSIDTSTAGRTIEVPITVISADETVENSTLIITRISTDDETKKVEGTFEVDGTNITKEALLNEDGVYVLYVKEDTDIVTLKITADEYATIKRNSEIGVETLETQVTLANEKNTYVNYTVTSEAGTTPVTYTVKIERQSSDAEIGSIKVDGKVITKGEDGIYYASVLGGTENAKVAITTSSDQATAQLNGSSSKAYLDVTVDTSNTENTYTIKITAEDGTTKEYTLKITRQTNIVGTILTENAEGKHSSKVIVYKTSDARTEDIENILNVDGTTNENVRQPVEQIETEEDGSFIIKVEDIEEYDIVVVKEGYLSYRVTGIGVVKGETTTLDEYNLIAGDVVQTGEIEIDDLVALNDNFGVTITGANKDTKSIYDLNEDGIVNKLDRDILKKNYGKQEETVEWVKPYAISMFSERLTSNFQSPTSNFILPMTCEYVITSEYGERIHPITGETSFHSGIDIVGEHYTEILAVADGEVTYAGVQSGYGNCVEIKHIVNGETIYSFYAHLSRIDVTVGQTVSQADVIGLEGGASTDPNPGTSTGHHLHFELRSASGSGHSLNPNNYIEF